MKAIIEIDDEYAKYYDVENLYVEIYAYGDTRPQETFVSLKPLPKKMGTTDDGNLETFILEGFSRGWNACLEEIEE